MASNHFVMINQVPHWPSVCSHSQAWCHPDCNVVTLLGLCHQIQRPSLQLTTSWLMRISASMSPRFFGTGAILTISPTTLFSFPSSSFKCEYGFLILSSLEFVFIIACLTDFLWSNFADSTSTVNLSSCLSEVVSYTFCSVSLHRWSFWRLHSVGFSVYSLES